MQMQMQMQQQRRRSRLGQAMIDIASILASWYGPGVPAPTLPAKSPGETLTRDGGRQSLQYPCEERGRASFTAMSHKAGDLWMTRARQHGHPRQSAKQAVKVASVVNHAPLFLRCKLYRKPDALAEDDEDDYGLSGLAALQPSAASPSCSASRRGNGKRWCSRPGVVQGKVQPWVPTSLAKDTAHRPETSESQARQPSGSMRTIRRLSSLFHPKVCATSDSSMSAVCQLVPASGSGVVLSSRARTPSIRLLEPSQLHIFYTSARSVIIPTSPQSYINQTAKMPKIMRLTLFKLPDQELVKSAIEMYNSLAQDAKKDGKQYIKLSQANAAHEDERSQGYTLMARCIFESLDDMNYYDKEDEAHLKIKSQFKEKVSAPPLVLYTDYHGP
ncbi:conserved hypothetical protein [Pyrenophora tritici-repentis Pt-1C-BFP]|uniref:Stress-response A/B barrel domain-containing protein n=1 Tax=Pyrenophora tritici-repentis (strain Pt-1C-BFP) TaxID=426418 RepID=B2VWD5_PYRTR|nr:uncharacterized protein PTRG_01497 [Pyrenophora tritici-repentis Pt-1C-BFP]EDU40935.1 conserved hypothetical protein [Pyrenophora tritici-repentis Pt-1C-BFP]